MEASTSNQPAAQEQPFPYPSGVIPADYVTLELSSKSYFVWEQLMIMFLESQDLRGFVDGTIKPDKPPALEMHSDLIDERWEGKKKTEEERQGKWNQNQLLRGKGNWDKDLKREREMRRRQAHRLWKADQEHRQKHLEKWEEWKRKWEKRWYEELKEFDHKEWGRRMKWIEEAEDRAKRKQRREKAEQRHNGWKRSDGLVKRWILALVTQEMLQQLIRLETALDVWIKLREILSPSFQLSHHHLLDMGEGRGEILSQYVKLHEAALKGDWAAANQFFEKKPNAALQPITCCSETALIVAVRSKKRNGFMNNLIMKMVQDSKQRENVEQERLRRMEQEMMNGMERMGLKEMGGLLREKMEKMELDMMQGIEGLEREWMKAMLLKRQERMELSLTKGMEEMDREGMVRTLEDRMEKFLQERMDESVPLLAQKDKSGATALHAAVEGGNKPAAELLLEKNPKLANIKENDGKLPVHVAADLGKKDMVELLLPKTTILFRNGSDPAEEDKRDELGHKLLLALTSSGLYDIASDFLEKNPRLAGLEPSPMVVIAQHCTAFRSGVSLNFIQRLIYKCILKLGGIAKGTEIANDRPRGSDIEINVLQERNNANHPQAWKKWNIALFRIIAEKLESKVLSCFNCRLIKSVRETNITHDQALNLVKCLCNKVVPPTLIAEIFTESLRSATRMGAYEIVKEILQSYPYAIRLRNEENQSLLHLAVMYHNENVFNLIDQMEEDWFMLLSMPDASENNALHLVGNLGLERQLDLQASAAGAALQMQRELQWFKEVENLILPQAKERKNKDKKTPQELFTETHKDLVEKGEKWMKSTANSCSIVAALITAVAFPTAITFPGGFNQSGRPNFLGDQAFTIFTTCAVLSMFFSAASLLMFLSIHMSRYAEQDFLRSLPTRMIILLATLYISIMSLLVAFGAALTSEFGNNEAFTVGTALFLFAAIFLVAWWNFPLLYDMIKSTYFPPKLRKQKRRK